MVDTLDNAHTIFETLNNRGKDLEVIDLVKNYIFKNYPSQMANNKNEKWKEIIKDIKGNKNNFSIIFGRAITKKQHSLSNTNRF